jgi:hypothetical protein
MSVFLQVILHEQLLARGHYNFVFKPILTGSQHYQPNSKLCILSTPDLNPKIIKMVFWVSY